MDNSARRPKWAVMFEVTTTVIMLVLAMILVWQGWTALQSRGGAFHPGPTPMPVPRDPVSIAGANVLGKASAKIALIEYADFECGACAVFANTVQPTLVRDYVDAGRVLLVYKDFPIQAHVHAAAMAVAAKCAGRQGKYWEMHDRLFADQRKSQDEELRQTARELNVDLAAFDACRTASDSRGEVESDRTSGKGLQVSATPTFLYGKVLPGDRVKILEGTIGTDLDTVKQTLDRLLK